MKAIERPSEGIKKERVTPWMPFWKFLWKYGLFSHSANSWYLSSLYISKDVRFGFPLGIFLCFLCVIFGLFPSAPCAFAPLETLNVAFCASLRATCDALEPLERLWKDALCDTYPTIIHSISTSYLYYHTLTVLLCVILEILYRYFLCITTDSHTKSLFFGLWFTQQLCYFFIRSGIFAVIFRHVLQIDAKVAQIDTLYLLKIYILSIESHHYHT